MLISLRGGTSARLFHPVETVDPQYNIVDCGIQYPDGAIDSVVVGGSFHTARKAYKSWAEGVDKEADSKEAAAHATREATNASDS